MRYLKSYSIFNEEAIVNEVSNKLSDIFDNAEDFNKAKLKDEVKLNIQKGLDIIQKQFPDLKIIDHFLVGAAITYQYEDGSDIDTTVVVDGSTPKDFLKVVDKWIEKNLDGKMKHNQRPYQFKVGYTGRENLKNADAVYDPKKDIWLKKTDVKQADKMYQSKISNKNSIENTVYSKMEKWIQSSFQSLYKVIMNSKGEPSEELKTAINNTFNNYTNHVKKLRGTSYEKDSEAGYVSQNWGKGNVIYKMFDREGYDEVWNLLKDMIKRNEYDNPVDLENLINYLKHVVNDEIGYKP